MNLGYLSNPNPDIQIVPNYRPSTIIVINEKPLETVVCKELAVIDNNIVCYIIILLVNLGNKTLAIKPKPSLAFCEKLAITMSHKLENYSYIVKYITNVGFVLHIHNIPEECYCVLFANLKSQTDIMDIITGDYRGVIYRNINRGNENANRKRKRSIPDDDTECIVPTTITD